MLTRPSDGGLWRSLLWRDSGEPVTTAGGALSFRPVEAALSFRPSEASGEIRDN